MFLLFWPVRLAAGIMIFFWALLVLSSCVLTVTAFLGERGWLWSLTTHFRMQYLMVQLVALLLVMWAFQARARRRKPRLFQWLGMMLLMFFAGLNLSQITPYYWPADGPGEQALAAAESPRLKLMHMNLYGYQEQSQALVAEAIRKQDPDVLDFVEYAGPWQRKLEASGVLNRYPYRVVHNHVGLYSKLPLRNPRRLFANPERKTTDQANVIAEIHWQGRSLTVLAGHPASPIKPVHLQWQRQSFSRWVSERSRLGKHLVLVGDLNTAPWSHEFQTLLEGTGLRDSQLGFGLQPTWPMFPPYPGVAHAPLWWTAPLRIPIDHVLVSPQVQVISRHTGPFIGSDHLPVVVELAWRAEQQT